MQRLTEVSSAQAWCRALRARGESLGFVATMGFLHEGHLALVEQAAKDNDHVCVSIFVNPLQFDDPADLERYPRNMEGDASMLEGAGCAMVFGGTLEGFFPGQLDERGELLPEHLVDPGSCALGLEGEYRRGHFVGVATIVQRLFEVVEPTRAYFGAKDYQQCLVVSEVGRRRGGPEVIISPTVREASGLALSSRNARLAAAGREQGLFISRALFAAKELWQQGERNAGILARRMQAVLEESELEVEYAAVRNPEHWSPEEPQAALSQAVALIAAKAQGQNGRVRLIDNMQLS